MFEMKMYLIESQTSFPHGDKEVAFLLNTNTNTSKDNKHCASSPHSLQFLLLAELVVLLELVPVAVGNVVLGQ